MKKLYAFSIITGQVFEIQEEDLKVLYNYQIPVTDLPKTNCKKCFGRGYQAKDVKTQFYFMCPCLQKHLLKGVDFSNLVVKMPRLETNA